MSEHRAREPGRQARDLERQALRALCAARMDPPFREKAGALLSGYQWRDPVHQVIFEMVVNLLSGDPRLIREQLPARLARRGFPDVVLDDLFRPLELSKEQAESLILQLVGERESR